MKQIALPKKCWNYEEDIPTDRTIKIGMSLDELVKLTQGIPGPHETGIWNIENGGTNYYHVSRYSCALDDEFKTTTCICIRFENGIVTHINRHIPYIGYHCDTMPSKSKKGRKKK